MIAGRAADHAARELGRVDVLVNNAATNPTYGPVQEIDDRAWDVIMNTNLRSVHQLSNLAREAMLEHGEGGALVHALPTEADTVFGLAYSPDGSRLASSGSDGAVRVWSAESGDLLSTIEGSGWVLSVAYSPDGNRLATGGIEGAVTIWDAATGDSLQTLVGHTADTKDFLGFLDAFVVSVAYNPDGTRLASGGGDGTIVLWDAATGDSLQTLVGHSDVVANVVFSPDGAYLASASQDETVRVWSVETGEALRTLEGHSNMVFGVAWSPAGTRLVSAGAEGRVRVWSVETGALLAEFEEHADEITSIAFRPDGAYLATTSIDGTVRLWDAETGAALMTLEGGTDVVARTVFSPDGTRLASAGVNQPIRVWNIPLDHPLNGYALNTHRAEVHQVAFNPDGSRLVSAGADGAIVFWDPLTRAAVDSIIVIDEGGTIVNISSGAATGALEGWSHYCATKAGVLSLTKVADKEYRDKGIRVIGLSPGTVATEMQVQIRASGINPVSKLDPSDHISPEWVAKAIAYLTTPAADAYRGTDFSLKTAEGRAAVGLPPA